MTQFSKYALVFALIMGMLLPMVAAATVDVTIVVIDKDGDEIEDATVILEYKNGTEIDDCDGKDTDGNGEVDCDNVEEGEDVDIKVTHPNYQEIDDTETLYDYDGDWDLIAVVMRPKATLDLQVTVVDQNNDEVKNADLTIESLDEDLDEDDFDSDYEMVVFPDEKSKYEGFEVDDSDEEEETDADGEAEFQNLEYNTRYNITVKKSGYPTQYFEYKYKDFDFDDDLDNEDVELEITQPGEGTFTAIVRDQESNELIEGAKVTVASKTGGGSSNENTGANGQAEFTLDTPDCFDIAVEKSGFSTDSQTNICLDNDDDVTSPFYLVSQNNGPVADAGTDQYVMVGDEVTLDASGSSDPDGDDLTYKWEDSLDIDIPNGEKPKAVFDVAGEHVVTLTVSDGDETSTDEVSIIVESPENCGDAICSLSEAGAATCPEDCPVCGDAVCGAGEADADQEGFYCPVDCNADGSLDIKLGMENSTKLSPGNKTTLVVSDPITGAPIVGKNAVIKVTAPDGSVTELTTTMGRAEYTFEEGGKYKIEMSADKYPTTTVTIEVDTPSNLGTLLMWALIVVVVIVAALFVVRFVNMKKKSGGGSGYRSKKYRKGKSTLGSI